MTIPCSICRTNVVWIWFIFSCFWFAYFKYILLFAVWPSWISWSCPKNVPWTNFYCCSFQPSYLCTFCATNVQVLFPADRYESFKSSEMSPIRTSVKTLLLHLDRWLSCDTLFPNEGRPRLWYLGPVWPFSSLFGEWPTAHTKSVLTNVRQCRKSKCLKSLQRVHSCVHFRKDC